MKGNTIVAEIQMYIYLKNIIVKTINIIKPNLMPPVIKNTQGVLDTEIKQSNSNNEQANINKVIETWLKNRCKKISDNDFDEFIINRLELSTKYSYERLYGCQYIVEVLDYFKTSTDDFWLNPKNDFYICNVWVNYRFFKLYPCFHKESKETPAM